MIKSTHHKDIITISMYKQIVMYGSMMQEQFKIHILHSLIHDRAEVLNFSIVYVMPECDPHITDFILLHFI